MVSPQNRPKNCHFGGKFEFLKFQFIKSPPFKFGTKTVKFGTKTLETVKFGTKTLETVKYGTKTLETVLTMEPFHCSLSFGTMVPFNRHKNRVHTNRVFIHLLHFSFNTQTFDNFMFEEKIKENWNLLQEESLLFGAKTGYVTYFIQSACNTRMIIYNTTYMYEPENFPVEYFPPRVVYRVSNEMFSIV